MAILAVVLASIKRSDLLGGFEREVGEDVHAGFEILAKKLEAVAEYRNSPNTATPVLARCILRRRERKSRQVRDRRGCTFFPTRSIQIRNGRCLATNAKLFA